MDNKIITADGVNINVDKHEDEKTKERRLKVPPDKKTSRGKRETV